MDQVSSSSSSSPSPSPYTSPPPGTSRRREGSVWEIYFPRYTEEHRDAIYIASFPQIVYFWPTILALFAGALFQGIGGENFFGWLTILVLSFNLLILVQDFDQKKFLILVLSVVAFFLCTWIVGLYGFTFISRIANWILGFRPLISTDAYLLFGTILLLLWIWGAVSPLFSYWKLEQNEFMHYSQPVGKDMSIARIGCSIYKEIPDIFECLLGFGAGCLVIRKENQVLATIPHIPFLSRRMEAIEHMLSETRVIVDKEV